MTQERPNVGKQPIYIREENRLDEIRHIIHGKLANKENVDADLLAEYNYLIDKFSKNIFTYSALKYQNREIEFLGSTLKTNYEELRKAFVDGFYYFQEKAEYKEIKAIIRCMIIENKDNRVFEQVERIQDLIDSLHIYANPNL